MKIKNCSACKENHDEIELHPMMEPQTLKSGFEVNRVYICPTSGFVVFIAIEEDKKEDA